MLAKKLRLEFMSFKNWSALTGALIVFLATIQGAISSGQGISDIVIITGVYLAARAYVDAAGNGTTAMAFRQIYGNLATWTTKQ